MAINSSRSISYVLVKRRIIGFPVTIDSNTSKDDDSLCSRLPMPDSVRCRREEPQVWTWRMAGSTADVGLMMPQDKRRCKLNDDDA
jgi:hypothetical protein